MLQKFCFIRNSGLILMVFGSGDHGVIKLILIKANFHKLFINIHYMLFLAAATYSLITELT